MDLEQFLNEYADKALKGVLLAALKQARISEKACHLAHVLDRLLLEDQIATHLPDGIRSRARAAMATAVSALPKAPHEAGSAGFDLAALIEPALDAMRSFSAPHVTPLLFLAACMASSDTLDPVSETARQQLRVSGITADMLLPGRSERTKQQDFTFRVPELGSDGLGTDMTAMARAGFWPSCPLVGMKQALEELVVCINAMSGSAAIIGEPGVGKSALINGLVWHIVHQTPDLIPPHMHGWTIVRIEVSDLVKGTGNRGDLETRVKDMLGFFGRNPTVVPFFEEMHKLLDTDDKNSQTIATALKVPMADGRFRCIGATTDREYARFIAGDDAMTARFRKIVVHEPNFEDACRIVRQTRSSILTGMAAQIGLDIEEEAVRAAVKVTSVYQKKDKLPRKAIFLLRDTVSEVVYRHTLSRAGQPPNGLRTVTADDVRRRFSVGHGIPVNELDGDPAIYRQNLEEALKGKVRGQDTAIASVARHLGLYQSGFLDQRRPRGRFLFLGPPGVGKTELALALAEQVMRERGSLVVVNMAEYTKDDAVTKFMGSSPGYVGFGETPTIYSRVMTRPYSVVVLDEFEKASGALANPMISILDGRGDDSQGRSIDFSQCIFVMTSNAIEAGDYTTAEGAIDEEAIRRELVEQGGIWTRPLVDRIDRITLFNSLSRAALEGILDRMITERRNNSGRVWPAEVDQPEVRATIIDWAVEDGGEASARRLERALLRWLSRHVLVT